MYGTQKLENIKYKKLNYKNFENIKFLVIAITCTIKVVTGHVKIIIIIIIIIYFRCCISYIDYLTTVPYTYLR